MNFTSLSMFVTLSAFLSSIGCSGADAPSEANSVSENGGADSVLDLARWRFRTGGTRSTGGSRATGGSTSTGGSKPTGGSVATGGTRATGGSPPTGGSNPTGGSATVLVTDLLHTEGNKILHANGARFHGRGANIFDTRQCGSCAWQVPHVDEVIRRVDELVDKWHANFMRFDLVSYASANYNGMTLQQWGDVTQDPNYLADLQKIVAHVGTKPGVYILITLFSHPSMDSFELPTAATMPVYKKLSDTFKNSPQVLYGVTNEPHGTTDGAVWTAMNNAVDAIRSMEPASGPHHVISVQGTQSYSRTLTYYVTHPITAGGGVNIVYETHAYNPPAEWQALFIDPAKTLPVIIGEFGPDGTYMTLPTAQQLMPQAESIEVPYIGWSFSPECAPGMIQYVDNVTDCGVGAPLTPSAWGNAIISQFAKPW